MYTYKRTEFSPFELYTVGTYDSGEWEPESDHSTKDEAAKRVNYLNGGHLETLKAEIKSLIEHVEQDTASYSVLEHARKLIFKP